MGELSSNIQTLLMKKMKGKQSKEIIKKVKQEEQDGLLRQTLNFNVLSDNLKVEVLCQCVCNGWKINGVQAIDQT